MTTQVYATQTTAYFDAAVAAFEAGGAALNIAGGTLVVGDGNGAVPSISALIAAGGVTHEVWRGQTIQSVSVDPSAANQLDIAVEIPAAIGGAEIGPFNVTEFAILDALGNCCVVGTTNLEKTVSSQGQMSDLSWIAAIVVSSTSAVTVAPPSAGFATMAQVIAAYNANLPSAQAPLTQTDTVASSGWKNRVFGISAASQPSDPVSTTTSAQAMGSGRPASAAEWGAGAPTTGGFAWPWPTLQQVTSALAALGALITSQGTSLASYLLKAGGTMTGPLVLAADPTVPLGAATKQYVDNKTAYSSGALPIGATLTVTRAYLTGSVNAVGASVTSAAGSLTLANGGSLASNSTLMPSGQTWQIVAISDTNFLGAESTGGGGLATASYTIETCTLMRTA